MHPFATHLHRFQKELKKRKIPAEDYKLQGEGACGRKMPSTASIGLCAAAHFAAPADGAQPRSQPACSAHGRWHPCPHATCAPHPDASGLRIYELEEGRGKAVALGDKPGRATAGR